VYQIDWKDFSIIQAQNHKIKVRFDHYTP